MLERRTRGLVLGLVLLLSSACGQPVAGEAVAGDVPVGTPTKAAKPSTTRPRPTTSSFRPPAATGLAALAGTWEGEYTCAQGLTGLKLTITAPNGDTLPTTLEFFALPSNPTVPSGSFSMLGSLGPGGQLVFRQQQWINQPPGYIMVDLAVTSPLTGEVSQLSGDMLNPDCKGFSVRKR